MKQHGIFGDLEHRKSDGRTPRSSEAGGADRMLKAVRRILVPVDSMEVLAGALVNHAVRLAELSGGGVWLLHFVRPASFVTDVDSAVLARSDAAMMEDARAFLERLKAQVPHGLVTVEVLVRRGPVASGICAVARELEAELIVMAKRSHDAAAVLFASGTVDSVIDQAPCPVLSLCDQTLK